MAPSRVKAFSWISFLGKQNTIEVIQRKRHFLSISPSMCPLCKRDEEFSSHIFIYCDYSSKVWNFFKKPLSLNFVIPESVENLFYQWGTGVKGDLGKMFPKVILTCVVWGIWKEINKRIFEDNERCERAVIDSIVYEISSWVLVKNEFSNCSFNDIVRD